jgi:hypothetical protein
MPPDTYANLGDQVVGWEWDAVVDNGLTPDGTEILMESPVFGLLLQDAGDSENANAGLAEAHTTRYVAPSGAIVFSSGTIQWAWGLGAQGPQVVERDPYLPQITYNILADMGVQPAAPQDYLILDGDEERLVTSAPGTFLDIESDSLPQISDISLDTSGDFRTKGRNVTFNWQTNVETTGQVWRGERAGHVIEPVGDYVGDDAEYSRQHAINVTGGMRPGHTYYFRLVSVDRAGHIVASDEFGVTMPGQPVMTGAFFARDTLRTLDCWARANPWLASGAGLIVMLGLVGFFYYVARPLLGRNRNRRSGGTS